MSNNKYTLKVSEFGDWLVGQAGVYMLLFARLGGHSQCYNFSPTSSAEKVCRALLTRYLIDLISEGRAVGVLQTQLT